MVVTDGVDGIADDGALVILLGFLKLLNGGRPGFVHHIKNFHGFGVRLIARLGGVDVNATTNEEHFFGGRQIRRARARSHLCEADAGGGRPRNGGPLEFGQAR